MRVFYTGIKTETGKDKLAFCQYPCPDKLLVERAEKLIRQRIPYDPSLMHAEGDHLYLHKSKLVGCGKCEQCRISASKKWAYRVLMEIGPNAKDAWFITLTFNDQWCPKHVDRKDVTMFMKRLRRELNVPGIRFFGCGEYGESGQEHRPHYHLIVWNCPLNDLMPSVASAGMLESPTIGRIWPYGLHAIGKVESRSVAYVARYTSKKTSERRGFLAMSTHPGIGHDYIKSHQGTLECDYYPLLVDGQVQRVNPPRYAEKILPDLNWEEKKDKRIWNAERSNGLLAFFHGCSGERLDDYMRNVYASKMARLAKKGI